MKSFALTVLLVGLATAADTQPVATTRPLAVGNAKPQVVG